MNFAIAQLVNVERHQILMSTKNVDRSERKFKLK